MTKRIIPFNYEKYLGKEFFSTYDRMTLEEVSYFENLNLKWKDSYVVRANSMGVLKRFAAIYLLADGYKEFITYTAKEFLDKMKGYDDDKTIYESPLIIYVNEHLPLRSEKQIDYVVCNLLDAIEDRNLCGLTTLILMEKDVPELTKGFTKKKYEYEDDEDEEIHYLDLRNYFDINKSIKKIVQKEPTENEESTENEEPKNEEPKNEEPKNEEPKNELVSYRSITPTEETNEVVKGFEDFIVLSGEEKNKLSNAEQNTYNVQYVRYDMALKRQRGGR